MGCCRWRNKKAPWVIDLDIKAFFDTIPHALVMKEIREMVRSWRLHRRSRHTLSDLAQDINAVVRGWINYYGAFYRSRLAKVLNAINVYLVRWAMHKYKRFRTSKLRAWRFLAAAARREPNLFAHWAVGVNPTGLGVVGAG